MLKMQVDELSAYTPKLAKKDDIMNRLQVLHQEVWEELNKKHETKSFERSFDALRTSLEEQVTNVQKSNDMMREVNDKMRKEVKLVNQITFEMRADVEKKLSQEEGKLIWANFQKYAVYNDLSDLYNRCLPSISSFEDKLHEFHTELLKAS